VGVGPVGVGAASTRQYYFFFGFFRINAVDAERLAAGKTSYSIRTEFGFLDFLLSPLLTPLTITTRTVTVEW